MCADLALTAEQPLLQANLESGGRYSSGVIDFQRGGLFAWPQNSHEAAAELVPILIVGEAVDLSFRRTRDSVVFINKRLITVTVQGMTGKKA